MTIFTEKTANLAQLKEGSWRQRHNFELGVPEGLSHFATQKNLSPKGLPKDKKFQTQIIRNAIRNLVRKKQSPQRKAKKSKSKSKSTNPEDALKKRATLSKAGRESIRSSKSRKLQKLFTRKNLSMSIDSRKAKELQKLQDLVFTSTMKYHDFTRNPNPYDYKSRPSTVKNREVGGSIDAKLSAQMSLQNSKKLKLVNLPLQQMDGFRFSKRAGSSKKDSAKT